MDMKTLDILEKYCGKEGLKMAVPIQTNEEWFCQLNTEDKAEWLAENKDENLCFICKTHCNPDNGCPMSAKDIWYAWLKEKHNE